ncbi:hypothetical protein Zm00014a_032174 [Zea mays]|uniref:Uncharacterized protein n=1 Tax=Zea mays TaxID=4577 RepID=A0A317YHN7_MAIZE|nr:hypothetical protein Zm00014a_032174 [Zea mays]
MAAEDSLSSLVSSEDEPDLDPVHSKETRLNPGSVSASTVSYRRQTSKERAIGLAPEFAFFKADKDEHSKDDDEEPCPDSQDWPGSFVTAVRMYEAREAKLRARELNSSKLNKSEVGECSWLSEDDFEKTFGKCSIESLQLHSVLRELYIADCTNVDAMAILPALQKINHLEVLAMFGIQSLCDKFVKGLIHVHGSSLKELAFAGCLELTSASIKTVGEYCQELTSLDLRNLNRLRDSALWHLRGCRLLRKLRLPRNAFSVDDGSTESNLLEVGEHSSAAPREYSGVWEAPEAEVEGAEGGKVEDIDEEAHRGRWYNGFPNHLCSTLPVISDEWHMPHEALDDAMNALVQKLVTW